MNIAVIFKMFGYDVKQVASVTRDCWAEQVLEELKKKFPSHEGENLGWGWGIEYYNITIPWDNI